MLYVLFKPTRSRLAALGVVAVLALAAGVAYATIPGSSGVIHGCYAKKHGGLRVIDMEAGQTCARHEVPLDWNQTGPQGLPGPPGSEGPRGPEGPPGPQGETGPSDGFSIEDNDEIPIPTGSPTTILARDVPAGKYVVSGNVSVANLNSTGTVPVNCYLGSPNEFSPPYSVRIDPFRFTSPTAPSGASAATIALVFTTQLGSAGTLSLLCQSNTGPGGLTGLAGPRQITAIRLGNIDEQDLAP